MRSGICPKCGHNDVRVGVNLETPNSFDVYVCVNCGYVELALTDADVLVEIAQNWPRVEQSPPGQQPG